VNVMGVVNGINAFVPTMIAQDEQGHVVNTTSSNGGFTPLVNSAVYAATKASVTTITECLWAQLREVDAKITASLLYPSTRTPGILNTGIWRPGANRPEKYDRPGAPPKEGRDGLGGFLLLRLLGLELPAFALDLLPAAIGNQQRQFPREQVIARIAVGDLHDLAPAAEIVDVFPQNNFHKSLNTSGHPVIWSSLINRAMAQLPRNDQMTR